MGDRRYCRTLFHNHPCMRAIHREGRNKEPDHSDQAAFLGSCHLDVDGSARNLAVDGWCAAHAKGHCSCMSEERRSSYLGPPWLSSHFLRCSSLRRAFTARRRKGTSQRLALGGGIRRKNLETAASASIKAART